MENTKKKVWSKSFSGFFFLFFPDNKKPFAAGMLHYTVPFRSQSAVEKRFFLFASLSAPAFLFNAVWLVRATDFYNLDVVIFESKTPQHGNRLCDSYLKDLLIISQEHGFPNLLFIHGGQWNTSSADWFILCVVTLTFISFCAPNGSLTFPLSSKMSKRFSFFSQHYRNMKCYEWLAKAFKVTYL